jgi:phosphoribosyl-ATP pyrophosphohydrolase
LPKPTRKKRGLSSRKAKPRQPEALAVRPKKIRKLKAVKSEIVVDPAKGEPGASGAAVLDRLWRLIEKRRNVAPAQSHSARLLARGPRYIVQKLGEEFVELIIEASGGSRAGLVLESADVLYHLLAVWISADIRPDEIWAELEKREAASLGVATDRLRTTKIP